MKTWILNLKNSFLFAVKLDVVPHPFGVDVMGAFNIRAP